MKEAFLPPNGPTPHSSFLSMAIAMGAMSAEEAAASADLYPMERTEPEKIFDRGCTAAQFSRYDEAVTVFSELLALEPQNWPALYNRALAYLYLGRFDKARAGFEEYARHEPAHARTATNLAHLFLLTSQLREAQEAARHALHLDADSRAAAANLGHSLIYTIRRAEAAEAYRRAVPAETPESDRARMIARLREDVEEFRRAGWPEDKLKELAVLVRQIELNPSGKKSRAGRAGRKRRLYRRESRPPAAWQRFLHVVPSRAGRRGAGRPRGRHRRFQADRARVPRARHAAGAHRCRRDNRGDGARYRAEVHRRPEGGHLCLRPREEFSAQRGRPGGPLRAARHGHGDRAHFADNPAHDHRRGKQVRAAANALARCPASSSAATKRGTCPWPPAA